MEDKTRLEIYADKKELKTLSNAELLEVAESQDCPKHYFFRIVLLLLKRLINKTPA